ncbi:hypothetical protein GCM10029976_032080 [Kribbella albertanoniae]|uniref:Uncharacterized protein n=1 Tax=Kribbella albertanoniae TaxID=1266829 RepID=A0A4R4QGY9_9ACTN|nr:hypothetical protein [Kribbella albertanoniae]TDC34981.1 hypothetical protein E1261_02025 [Kribbella albertanoniae]
MRTTYEDLLRAARRSAVEAAQSRYKNRSEAVDDWRAVVAASAVHLRWLRHRFRAADLYDEPAVQSDRPLGRLAQAIGAGSDLLALQDASNASLLDDPWRLRAARAEVAAIALTGADCVIGHTRSRTPERRLAELASGELEKLARHGEPSSGLGELGLLSAGGPVSSDDELSMLPRRASRWERADDDIAVESLLTRDLRSTTAQIRCVCGYVWHLACHLLASSQAELSAVRRLELGVLKQAVRSAEAGALRTAESWRRRLSDLDGHTGTPSEVMFLDLRAALDQFVRPEGRLLEPDVLVPDHATAVRVLEVVDEIVWSAEQVARRQQRAAAVLVSQGRLFVPRQDVSKQDPRYLNKPNNTKLLQGRWLRTTRPEFFAALTACLAWSADHLSVASDVARRLAGTSLERRPSHGQPLRKPAPDFELPELLDVQDQGRLP